MSTTSTMRPVVVAMIVLIAAMAAAIVAPVRFGGGLTQATTTLYQCQGTWYFDSSSAGVTFSEGDVWQDGEFTDIENDHMMLVRLDNGHEVGRFPQGSLLGDEATIQFGSAIRITAILWHDNDPNPGEAGWSFNGIVGPVTGDGVTAVTPVDITTSTVNIMAGGDSGGIDFCFTLIGGGEGCTPGYWKQEHHFDSWVGYSPHQTLESVFDVPDAYGLDNHTLVQALGFGGGPGVNGGATILLRAAVASLLNSTAVDFEYSTAEVIAQVNAALASNDRGTMLALAMTLDSENNEGCPLN